MRKNEVPRLNRDGGTPAPPLRDYIFLDGVRLDSYVDQRGGLPARNKCSRKVSISLTGPSAEMSSEEVAASGSAQEKVDFLIGELLKMNQLRGERPVRNTVTGRPLSDFVLEEMVATPVIIPKSKLPSDLPASGMRIWISDPDPKSLAEGEWDFSGSFVYLTEIIFDDTAAHHFYSGCSALRMIANHASGQQLLDHAGGEYFGRWDGRHPADKLADVGGMRGDPRRITSLYRIRYMSDEQTYTEGGQERRVHDILGYPIFIAAT